MKNGTKFLGAVVTGGLMLTLAGPAHAQYFGHSGSFGAGSYNRPAVSRGFLPRLGSWLNRQVTPINNRFRAPYAMRDQRINLLQARLDSKIRRGIANGSLTRKEAAMLGKKFQQIAEREQSMRNSGSRFTEGERKNLLNRLANLDKQIDKQMNDNQRTVVAYGRFPYFGF